MVAGWMWASPARAQANRDIKNMCTLDDMWTHPFVCNIDESRSLSGACSDF